MLKVNSQIIWSSVIVKKNFTFEAHISRCEVLGQRPFIIVVWFIRKWNQSFKLKPIIRIGTNWFHCSISYSPSFLLRIAHLNLILYSQTFPKPYLLAMSISQTHPSFVFKYYLFLGYRAVPSYIQFGAQGRLFGVAAKEAYFVYKKDTVKCKSNKLKCHSMLE